MSDEIDARTLERAAEICQRRSSSPQRRRRHLVRVLLGLAASTRAREWPEHEGWPPSSPPFDTGSPEYQRGVEFGILWIRAKYDSPPVTASVHADLAEAVIRLAEHLELPFSGKPHEHGEGCSGCVGRHDCKDGEEWLDVLIG